MNDYTMMNYQTVGNYNSGAAVAAGMFGGLFILFYIIVIALMLMSMWKIFVKAGKAGWASLVPIYNTIVMLEIARLPIWYILLMFVPIVNVIISVVVMAKIAKVFGKDPFAAKAPAANNIESPGKSGNITKPVSTKIIKNKIP